MAEQRRTGTEDRDDQRQEDGAAGRGGFKASRHGDGKRKASAAGPKATQKRAAEQREHTGTAHTAHEESKWLQGGRIEPRRIDGTESAADLIDGTFLAYNARAPPRGLPAVHAERCSSPTSPSA